MSDFPVRRIATGVALVSALALAMSGCAADSTAPVAGEDVDSPASGTSTAVVDTHAASVDTSVSGVVDALSFTVSHRPSVDFAAGLAAMQLADVDAGSAEPVPPVYADIEAFPVLDAQSLDNLMQGFKRRGAQHLAAIASIDFDRQFAFVVSHPASEQREGMLSKGAIGSYEIQPRLEYAGERIDLALDARRVGSDFELSDLSFPADWESTVYVFDRNDATALHVSLDGQDYRFSLQPPVVEDVAQQQDTEVASEGA